LPSNIITGSKLYPDKDIQSIAVTYSRFPGCIETGRLLLSVLVITFVVEITPIWKPVLLKLYISSSWILYFAIVFSIK
jgi:hypothetical protein